MIAATFGLGGVELLILLLSWFVVISAVASIFFLVAASLRERRRAAERHAQLVDEFRRLRDEIAELKQGRA
jgi:hypothetical protein